MVRAHIAGPDRSGANTSGALVLAFILDSGGEHLFSARRNCAVESIFSAARYKYLSRSGGFGGIAYCVGRANQRVPS